METSLKENDATENRPEGHRALDGRLVEIDLNEFIDIIKTESAWKEKDRNAITIFKNDVQTMVLIALHHHALMAEHTAKGCISVQVLEGRIQFKTNERTVSLSKGNMITLGNGIPHSVLAEEESVFLLTVTTQK